jgi:predicted aldo/keto reductase-like oxidoreductase
MRLPKNAEAAEKLLAEAVGAGINYFDTAYMYAGNEAALGRFFAKSGLREKVKIATKIPPFMCRERKDFDKIFSKQLAGLKTDYIDYYLFHMLNNPEQWRELREAGAEEWVAEKKERGEIRQIGFSFHGKQDDFIGLVDAYDWEFCQIQYNYLDVNNQAGLKGLKYAASKGIPVFIMEPLRGGLLARELPAEAEKIMREAKPSVSPAAWALGWLWNHEEITLLLSGMKTAEQLRENIAAAETEEAFTERENGVIEKVAEIFKASNKIPCTGCGYCMPCPFGVNIPGCLASYNASRGWLRKRGINQYVMNTGALMSNRGLASSCAGCGKCEPRCPQSIPVRDSLKIVVKRMEPLWFKTLMPLARRFMGVKRKKKADTDARP